MKEQSVLLTTRPSISPPFRFCCEELVFSAQRWNQSPLCARQFNTALLLQTFYFFAFSFIAKYSLAITRNVRIAEKTFSVKCPTVVSAVCCVLFGMLQFAMYWFWLVGQFSYLKQKLQVHMVKGRGVNAWWFCILVGLQVCHSAQLKSFFSVDYKKSQTQ